MKARVLRPDQVARLEALRSGTMEHWRQMAALQEKAARIIAGRNPAFLERARDHICEWAGDEYPAGDGYPAHSNPSVADILDRLGVGTRP